MLKRWKAGSPDRATRNGEFLNNCRREARPYQSAAKGRSPLKGEPLVLAPQEFDLLQALIEEPKRVLTRSEAKERLDGPSEACGGDEGETYVHGLQTRLTYHSCDSHEGMKPMVKRHILAT